MSERSQETTNDEQRTTNKERRTKNDEQRTTNKERRTKNDEQRTAPNFGKFGYRLQPRRHTSRTMTAVTIIANQARGSPYTIQ